MSEALGFAHTQEERRKTEGIEAQRCIGIQCVRSALIKLAVKHENVECDP